MTWRKLRRACLALVLLAGCGGAQDGPDTAPHAEPVPPPRPRLVLAVVLDQLGWATLERSRPYLDEDGLVRRMAREGADHRVEYQHAATYTAAGHASIFTGVSPRVHGVMANRIFDPVRGEVASCDDGSCPIFGREGHYASPAVLRAPSVADALRAARPEARIVSISYKDRGSVIPGGQRPDAVAFWDKAHGRFTTSSFYGERLPAWLERFTATHPTDTRMTPWEPEDPALLERVLGPDDRTGEGGIGFGPTFPHDPNDAGDEPAYSAFRATPQATELLLELARAAVAEHEMGRDEVPDLLTISVSGTDYVGHTFGRGSWEYLDNLRRVDRALGRLAAELEAERGPIAVLLTSDHGHSDITQAMEGGGRIRPARFLEALDAAIDAEVGEGDWTLAYTEPFIYLSDEARDGDARDRVMDVALAHLPRHGGVERAYDAARVQELAGSDDPIDRLVYESVAAEPPGDVFVVLARGWMVDDDAPYDAGASHGTPWAYDREVPALFLGPGVSPLRSEEPLDQRRVAATIAALLGIPGPGHAPAEPLPGAPLF